jgi:hypothetical protein
MSSFRGLSGFNPLLPSRANSEGLKRAQSWSSTSMQTNITRILEDEPLAITRTHIDDLENLSKKLPTVEHGK